MRPLKLMAIMLVILSLVYCWLVSLSQGPSVSVLREGSITEIVLRVPVYVVIFGQPLSYAEFVGAIVGMIALLMVTILGILEYTYWRRRKLLRALTTYRHEGARLPESEYQIYPPFYAMRRRWSAWYSESRRFH